MLLMSKKFNVHVVEDWFGISKNDYANSANNCKELDPLTAKRIKFAAFLFLWCHI